MSSSLPLSFKGKLPQLQTSQGEACYFKAYEQRFGNKQIAPSLFVLNQIRPAYEKCLRSQPPLGSSLWLPKP